MTITKMTISCSVKLSRNYQSTEQTAAIEIALLPDDDRKKAFTDGSKWLRALCLKEASATIESATMPIAMTPNNQSRDAFHDDHQSEWDGGYLPDHPDERVECDACCKIDAAYDVLNAAEGIDADTEYCDRCQDPLEPGQIGLCDTCEKTPNEAQ